MSARRYVAAGLLALSLTALSAAPAGAATKLGLLTSFGTLEQPNDIAVDQSNDDVFVSDVSTHAVHVFARKSATEYEQIGELTGAETPGHEAFAFAGGEPAPVAVDSTSGDVYIADIGHHAVDRFAPKGPGEYQYECQITGFHAGCHPNLSGEEGTPEPHFGETAGLAVDSQGDLYVADYTHNVVDEFKSNGEDVGQIESALTKEPANLAIDAMDDLYVSQFEGPVQKLKIDPATGTIEHEQADFGPEGSRDVAVDPSTNDVYVAYLSHVAHYEALGTELTPISLTGMVSEGVAVNGATHEIYISDKGHEDIEVYGPVTVPDVKTGPSIGITKTSAALTGEVNPLGTSAASYYFEYGETTAYGATTPAPPGVGAGSGNVFSAVTPQQAEGLLPGTTYHYRLDATNSSGLLEEGEDRTFTTLPEEPKVEEPPASVANITTESVIFNGTVKPGNGATTYHFIYGTTEAYGNVLPNVGIGAGFDPVEVEQASGLDLRPNTLYHFALVARNASGTAIGHDQTFRTLPAASRPEADPVISTGPAIAITPNGAVLTGTVSPENTPTTYLFELGTTTAYGTQLYGGEAGREGGPQPASVEAGNLQPGTEYHYRLVAVNAAGTSVGADGTFTTSTFPQQIFEPLTPLLVPTPVFPAVKNPVYKPPKKHRKPTHKKPKPKRRRAHGGRAARRRRGH